MLERLKKIKKITIVLMPDNTQRVMQLKFSAFLLPFFAFCLLVYMVFFISLISEYRELRVQMPRLAHLEIDNEHKTQQLLWLSKRVDRLTKKMNGFWAYNPEQAGLKNGERMGSYQSVLGMGGSGPNPFRDSDDSLESTHRELIRFMHLSLDKLDDEISLITLASIEESLFFGEEANQRHRFRNSKFRGEKEIIQEQLKATAVDLGIDPHLALSMAKVESGYNPKSVSHRGAVGVLQVMPQLAWSDYRITREMLFDPQINIRVGLSMMKSILVRFDYNLDLSLAAYNAGPSRVVRAGYRIPRIRETRAYVKKVKNNMNELYARYN
ncbi:lytic transglycosylase domain-containing protein [Thermodesulfobacteriota bacterium]